MFPKILFLESLKASRIRAFNIVTKKKHSFKQSGESLTINPLAGSICTQFMWGMKSGILVLLALAFYGSTTEKVFFSHKNHRKFSFYCSEAIPRESRPALKSIADWFFQASAVDSLGFFSHTMQNKIKLAVRHCSLKEKLKSLNRGKLKSEGKYLKTPLLSSTGLVPEQEIKGAPTETTHEHGSRAVLWRIEKARISDELIAWWSWRGRVPILRQR